MNTFSKFPGVFTVYRFHYDINQYFTFSMVFQFRITSCPIFFWLHDVKDRYLFIRSFHWRWFHTTPIQSGLLSSIEKTTRFHVHCRTCALAVLSINVSICTRTFQQFFRRCQRHICLIHECHKQMVSSPSEKQSWQFHLLPRTKYRQSSL